MLILSQLSSASASVTVNDCIFALQNCMCLAPPIYMQLNFHSNVSPLYGVVQITHLPRVFAGRLMHHSLYALICCASCTGCFKGNLNPNTIMSSFHTCHVISYMSNGWCLSKYKCSFNHLFSLSFNLHIFLFTFLFLCRGGFLHKK